MPERNNVKQSTALQMSEADYRFLMRSWNFPVGNSDDARRAQELQNRLRSITAQPPPGRLRTAVHEASHCVVAKALGWDVREVFFRNDDEGRYVAATPNDPLFDVGRYVREQAIIGEAGNAGEEIEWRYARNPERRLFPLLAAYLMGLPESECDRDDLDFPKLYSLNSNPEPFLRALDLMESGKERAKQILRSNRRIVRSISAQLRSKDRLDGDYLRMLLREVRPNE